MNIIEALLQPGTRISNTNNRWLVMNEVMDEMYRLGGEFVVYERPNYAKKTMELYRGDNEEEAVAVLLDLDTQDDYGYSEQKNFD